jgi:hypothetical protein
MPFRGIGFIGKFGNGMNGRGMKPKLGEGAGQTGVFVRPPGLEKFARPNTENTSIVFSEPFPLIIVNPCAGYAGTNETGSPLSSAPDAVVTLLIIAKSSLFSSFCFASRAATDRADTLLCLFKV